MSCEETFAVLAHACSEFCCVIVSFTFHTNQVYMFASIKYKWFRIFFFKKIIWVPSQFFPSYKLVKFKFCTPVWGQWLTVVCSVWDTFSISLMSCTMLASTFLFTLFLNSKGFIFNTKPVDSLDTSIEQNDIAYYDNNVYSDNEDPMEKKTDDDFDDKVNVKIMWDDVQTIFSCFRWRKTKTVMQGHFLTLLYWVNQVKKSPCHSLDQVQV